MLRISRIPALVALTLTLPALLLAAAPRPRQTVRAAHSRLAKPGAAKQGVASPASLSAAPQPAVQPLRPLRPSQMPAVPPRVSYQNGLLTIIAPNSTLAEIVSAVHNATGIQIEGAPSGQRMAAKIGPAPVRSVLLSLFDGSKFDYVILGSATDPQQVQRVILTPQLGGGAVANNNPAPPPPPEQDVPEDNSDQNADYVAPPDEQPQPQQPPQQMQPVPAAQQANPWGAPNPDASPDQQVKTPQQLMEELRQQQLQQEQNNANNPNPNPRQEQPIPH